MQAVDIQSAAQRDVVRLVAWTCRAESVLWLLLLLPIAGAFAGMLPLAIFTGKLDLIGVSLLFAVATPALIAAGLWLSAMLFDFVLNVFRSRVRPIPQAAAKNLAPFLAELAASGLPQINTARIRYMPSDLSLGAHVRGVLAPRIIVSGGALISLMRRDPLARAMFAHELAHISHWDRLYVGLLAVAIVNAAMPLFMLIAPNLFYRNWDPYYFDRVLSAASIGVHLLSVGFQFFVFSFFSKRREYAADYVAVRAVGETPYLALLEKAGGSHHGSFFHPTVEERIEAVRSGRRVEKPAWPVLVLAAVNCLPMLLLPMVDFNRSGEQGMVRMAGALSVAMYFAVSELMRFQLRSGAQAKKRYPHE